MTHKGQNTFSIIKLLTFKDFGIAQLTYCS